MRRRAFTLVELLVVITILGLLASMVLFALVSSMEAAKEAKTRSTISKLNAIVMAKYESYRTRRVPVKIFSAEPYTDKNGNFQYDVGEPFLDYNGNSQRDAYTTVDIAKFRLGAIYELMRLEMPDSFNDIDDPPLTPNVIGGTTPMQRPSSNKSYQSVIPVPANRTSKTISAECLYLLVTRGCDDPDVIEQFQTNEIGTATDGMKYFVDGWGNPIYFLRWAPAYVSPLQPSPPTEHDPFDPLGVVAGDFPLYPLIYSAGSDGHYDITADNSASPIRYGKAPIKNNPFHANVLTIVGKQEDSDGDGVLGFADNITNHDGE